MPRKTIFLLLLVILTAVTAVSCYQAPVSSQRDYYYQQQYQQEYWEQRYQENRLDSVIQQQSG